jgi:hypothetical protein
MSELKLKMPINIKATVDNDGYVITDADNTEHFFYEKDGELEYDGWSREFKSKKDERR